MRLAIPLLSASKSFAAAIVLGLAATGAATAQGSYPSKPVTFVVPYSAGGSTDLSARTLAKLAGDILGQPISVVNKPGAAGAVGLGEVAKSAPDGYTIGIFNAITNAIVPHMRKVPYDPIDGFEPIVIYGGYQSFVAVQKDKPWKTLDELVAYAKANPKALTVGVSGVGSSTHLGVARLMSDSKATVTFVPFGGGAPTTTALLGGHVAVAAVSSEVLPHVQTGAVRLLTVLQDVRLPEYPDLKSVRQLGYNWDINSWVGVAAPKGTDPAALEKLRAAFMQAASSDEFKAQMKALTLLHYAEGPETAKRWIRQSHEELGAVVKELKIGLYAQ